MPESITPISAVLKEKVAPSRADPMAETTRIERSPTMTATPQFYENTI